MAGVETFYSTLQAGVDLPTIPAVQRSDIDQFYTPEGSSTGVTTRFAAFLSHPELFDAAAFRLPYPEALHMDPHSRMLLEHVDVCSTTQICHLKQLGHGSCCVTIQFE